MEYSKVSRESIESARVLMRMFLKKLTAALPLEVNYFDAW